MVNTWILLISLSTGASYGSASVTVVEFSNERSCRDAAARYVDNHRSMETVFRVVSVMCFPKKLK